MWLLTIPVALAILGIVLYTLESARVHATIERASDTEDPRIMLARE